MISGILLILGRRVRMYDPCGYMVFYAFDVGLEAFAPVAGPDRLLPWFDGFRWEPLVRLDHGHATISD